jgi:hypothetical protein
MSHSSRPGALGAPLSWFRLLTRAWRRLRLPTLFLLLAAVPAYFLYPDSSRSQAPAPPPPPAPAVSPLDQPLRLMLEARQAYQQNVHDYTCLFVKREHLHGQLQPENVISMKVRAQPFSVYLNWQGPKAVEGQEVCYVAGANKGQMRVHSVGLLGVVGWVSLEPDDPRALENSRHKITEAGIGNLIEKFIGRYETEIKLNRTQVKMGEYEFNKKRCIRIETIHPSSKSGDYYAYRSVVFLDKETKLPIRSEAYDWPKAGGDPNGDLLECFSYVQLKLNVGLRDDAFNY